MKSKYIRFTSQFIFFVLIAMTAIRHNLGFDGPSLHAVCPFGGVVTFYNYIIGAALIKKIQVSSIFLMYMVFIFSFIAGPLFCGWICPLGSIQEWIGVLGKKVLKEKYNKFISTKVHNKIKYLRIVVLFWVLYMTIKTAEIIFLEVDPYFALFNFWTGEVSIISITILLITLISSLLVERPWCKYLCPYGAMLGFFNKVRIFTIRRNDKTCIHCHSCSNNCPMNIDVENLKAVRDLQCISCLQCTSESSCPIEDTVSMKIGGEKK
ncbi:4Fe-4S binding protein [Peptostreptococcaceae bacterium AGR-M142]